MSQPMRTYDVLKPVIQTKDEGVVEELHSEIAEPDVGRRNSAFQHGPAKKTGDTLQSLQAYAKHLVAATEAQRIIGEHASLPPSQILPLARVLSPSSPALDMPEKKANEDSLSVPGTQAKLRPRKGSFVAGDDELLEAGEGCGQAVEVLSRHSMKSESADGSHGSALMLASYDIAKDGEIVAVLTLIKSTYRLGESVLGVVTFNQPSSERRVLKVGSAPCVYRPRSFQFCAYLESHEIIPENLLPLSPSSAGHSRQPPLTRLHAEHLSAYAIHTSQLSFSLDIPSDATPAFSVSAGEGGFNGGLEWRVKLSFLVSCTRKRSRASLDGRVNGEAARNMVQTGGEGDNRLYAATQTLEPVYKEAAGAGLARTEVIDCEIPIKVLAGNTAFLVKPSVHVI